MTQILKKLAKAFQYIGETEMQIEFARQNLCRCNNFEPYASFQRIDRDGKGFITGRDFCKYMK